MALIPTTLVNMNYCLPALSGANGSCRGLFFCYHETVNTDYIYDSL